VAGWVGAKFAAEASKMCVGMTENGAGFCAKNFPVFFYLTSAPMPSDLDEYSVRLGLPVEARTRSAENGVPTC
jgi:hypothetical protein